MTDLTNTQTKVLKLAMLNDGQIIEWPDSVRGGAQKKVLDALINKGMAAEQDGEYHLTDAGRQATAPEKQKPRIRPGTKQAMLIEMLQRPEGATVTQMAESTGWQRHTVFGAIAGQLKKKLGLTIESAKNDDGERVYKIA